MSTLAIFGLIIIMASILSFLTVGRKDKRELGGRVERSVYWKSVPERFRPSGEKYAGTFKYNALFGLVLGTVLLLVGLV